MVPLKGSKDHQDVVVLVDRFHSTGCCYVSWDAREARRVGARGLST